MFSLKKKKIYIRRTEADPSGGRGGGPHIMFAPENLKGGGGGGGR